MRKRPPAHPSKSLDLTSINAPDVVLAVQTHTFTGRDPKTRPGVSFEYIVPKGFPLLSLPDGRFRVPFGVVDRDQVRALRDLLDGFLGDVAEDVGGPRA